MNNNLVYELNKLNTIKSINDINIVNDNNTEKIFNKFWQPNELIIQKLSNYCETNKYKNILEVGPGFMPFPKSNYFIDTFDKKEDNYFKIDIDYEKFPFPNDNFDFIYCRHVLEDIQNPLNAFNEIIRVCKSGFIETPSPLIEFSVGVDSGDAKHKGYIHHRYFVWSDIKNNTLYFLPKYPIIEHYKTNIEFIKKINKLANEYPVYWNNYYMWDENNKPNIYIYRNGINFELQKEYVDLINEAIFKSFEYTNYIINKINNF
jgi:ubiquinone/menaquinone biosynthesis C-methylase UbiE